MTGIYLRSKHATTPPGVTPSAGSDDILVTEWSGDIPVAERSGDILVAERSGDILVAELQSNERMSV
ncbi:MAG: hypothetical protein OXT71_11800 [Acidobacteriota bacterium]|nr:hypothetical protein [Acidobacteriota bacterium]